MTDNILTRPFKIKCRRTALWVARLVRGASVRVTDLNIIARTQAALRAAECRRRCCLLLSGVIADALEMCHKTCRWWMAKLKCVYIYPRPETPGSHDVFGSFPPLPVEHVHIPQTFWSLQKVKQWKQPNNASSFYTSFSNSQMIPSSLSTRRTTSPTPVVTPGHAKG